jgi:hypothetical protein
MDAGATRQGIGNDLRKKKKMSYSCILPLWTLISIFTPSYTGWKKCNSKNKLIVKMMEQVSVKN